MSQAPLDVTRLKHGFIFGDVTSQISLPNPPKPPNGITGNTRKPREVMVERGYANVSAETEVTGLDPHGTTWKRADHL